MRITNRAVSALTILNMQRNLSKVEETRSRMALGRRLLRPSDDPVDVSRALGFRNKVTGIQQHIRNIDNGLIRLNMTESALGGANEMLMELKQLALQLGTEPTVTSNDRENATERIEQIKKQFLQLASTKIGGQYIFAGSKTKTLPYEANGDQVFYNGNDAEILIEVEDESTVPINIPGIRVFDTSEDGIFQMLNDFKTFLSQNDKEALKEMSARIDTHTETVLSARATNAARTQRMDIARERRLDDEIGTTQALSHTEDIDLARTITELVDLQNAYEASLSATARTIQPSLLSVLG